MSKSVEIPTYYVDLNTGLKLLVDLGNLFKSNNTDATGLYVRVVLLPSDNQALDHWQFALIIVGILLISSICVICKCC